MACPEHHVVGCPRDLLRVVLIIPRPVVAEAADDRHRLCDRARCTALSKAPACAVSDDPLVDMRQRPRQPDT